MDYNGPEPYRTASTCQLVSFAQHLYAGQLETLPPKNLYQFYFFILLTMKLDENELLGQIINFNQGVDILINIIVVRHLLPIKVFSTFLLISTKLKRDELFAGADNSINNISCTVRHMLLFKFSITCCLLLPKDICCLFKFI